MFDLLVLADSFMSAIREVANWLQTPVNSLSTYIGPFPIEIPISGFTIMELLLGGGLVVVLGVKIWQFVMKCLP